MNGYLIVMILGLVVAGFGALLIIRYPDRRGGTVKALTIEVNAPGAGVVVIVLGLAAVIYAAPYVSPSSFPASGAIAPTASATIGAVLPTPTTVSATSVPTASIVNSCASTALPTLHCSVLSSLVRHRGAVWDLSFAANGWRLLSGAYNPPHAIVWDAVEQAAVFDVTTSYLLGGAPPGAIIAAAWNPTSDNKVATGAFDGTVDVWDANTGTRLSPLTKRHTQQVWALAWDPAGRLLASGSEDGKVLLWDPGANSLPTRTTQARVGAAYALAWLSSGTAGGSLAVGGAEASIVLWDTTNGQTTSIPRSGTREIRSLAWSPAHRALASGDEGGGLHVWEQTTGDVSLNPLHGGSVRGLVWSKDGKLLASGGLDGVLKLWQWSEDHVVFVSELRGGMSPAEIHALAWSANNILAIGRQDGRIDLVRVEV